MRNIEKYMNEIIEIALSREILAIEKENNKPVKCCEIECDKCLFDTEEGCSADLGFKWADAEYIEPMKISKKDRSFLDYLKLCKYIARDDNGNLYAYASMPIKLSICWGTATDCKSLAKLDIDFPMVKWSDEEPWLIEDLKELEVVDEYE